MDERIFEKSIVEYLSILLQIAYKRLFKYIDMFFRKLQYMVFRTTKMEHCMKWDYRAFRCSFTIGLL